MQKDLDQKWVYIKNNAKVFIDGKMTEWHEGRFDRKILQVDSVIRKRTRMRLLGQFSTVTIMGTKYETKKVLAWFDDLVFAKFDSYEVPDDDEPLAA